MAKQIKPKYPADREKKSQAFANGEVSTDIFTTHPRTMFTIGGPQSDAIVNDIQNAIDEILTHYGK